MWRLQNFLPSGQSLHLLHLPCLPFVLHPCVLHALLSLGSQPLATLTKATPACGDLLSCLLVPSTCFSRSAWKSFFEVFSISSAYLFPLFLLSFSLL